MNPKILHLIEDKIAGGSTIYVTRLITSHLKEEFNFFVGQLEKIKPKIKHLNPDLIVFHYACAWRYLPQLLCLKQYGKLAVVDHHYCQGFEQYKVSSLSRFHFMLRLAYGLADIVIAVSQAQRQWMIANKLVPSEKIRVISGAAPMQELLKIDIPTPNTPYPKSLTIGAYGRFAPQKGFDILLQAFSLVDRDRFRLRLGGYGQDEEKIRALAAKLTHVELLGAIKDVPGFLATCDAIVIPSRWESWGLVCLEAKAAGKPIIASAVDGLCEQLDSCGLLVTPNNVEKLAKAISLFLGIHWQSQGVATSVLIAHGIFMPLFTIWATRYVFNILSKNSAVTKPRLQQ